VTILSGWNKMQCCYFHKESVQTTPVYRSFKMGVVKGKHGYEYDNKQYLKRSTSDDGQLIIWEITGGNAQGQVTNYNIGNGLAIEKDYDDDYFPKSTTAYNGENPVFSFLYEFDPVTGNLTSRNLHGTEEHFFYDTDGKQLNRLAGTGPDENTVSENYLFANNGNITVKTGVGTYHYDNDRKNAVSEINFPAVGTNPIQTQHIIYNHFNSASEIENLDDDLELLLEYGPDQQRRKAVYTDDGDPLKTRIYAGSYEKQINADNSEIEVHYISAGGMLVAMYVIDSTEEPEQGEEPGQMYYPHLDHLGSIIHITDASGEIVETFSYDAWGRPRNPNDLSYNNVPERPDWLWRGYTGHEHLDEFGLINMNGRLYDPVVGRMLSPDNYVQSPDFTQSYNRYSYVWNNPLKYTDPSGEIVWAPVIIGAIVGAYIGGSVANNSFNITQWDPYDANTYIGMGIGAVVGAVGGHYVGGAIKAGKGATVLANTYAGGLNVAYNYNPDQSVATQLSYFAAGYAAAGVGSFAASSGGLSLGQAKVAAMVAGGSGNMVVAGFSGEITDGYTAAQAFVGGALVGYAGTSYFSKTAYAKKAGIKSKYLFGKGSQLAIEGAWTSTAADFAFSDKDEYLGRSGSNRLITPMMGALGGTLGGMAMESDLRGLSRSGAIRKLTGGVLLLGAYGSEYIGVSFSKGYHESLYTGGWEKKAAVSGYKSLFYNLILH